MQFRYMVVYRDYSGHFIKKIVESYSDWFSCVIDITGSLNITVNDIVSISLDTNPPVETD